MTRTKATHRFDDTISVSRATMRRLVLAAYQAGDPRPIAEVIADRVERALDALDREATK